MNFEKSRINNHILITDKVYAKFVHSKYHYIEKLFSKVEAIGEFVQLQRVKSVID
jgi:hypothetical protein